MSLEERAGLAESEVPNATVWDEGLGWKNKGDVTVPDLGTDAGAEVAAYRLLMDASAAFLHPRLADGACRCGALEGVCGAGGGAARGRGGGGRGGMSA
jgi:hypothetical protein